MPLITTLRDIAEYVGVKSPTTILNWSEKLGFPLMIHPTSKLKGKNLKFASHTVMIDKWLLVQSEADMNKYWQVRNVQSKLDKSSLGESRGRHMRQVVKKHAA